MKKQIVYIVELKKAYEDKHYVHLVMGFSTGGELFDRIIATWNYLEKAAVFFVEKHCSDCAYLSWHGAIHRDLKPENFLLLNEDENSPLKTINFGLSDFYKPGNVFKDIVGDAYYIALETLKRKYESEAVIWSIGVILYIILCGVSPFWTGKNIHFIISRDYF